MKAIFYTILLAAVFLVGCEASSTPVEQSSVVGTTGGQYLVDAEPANATPVGDARKDSSDGDKITLVGHIGGSTDPFVEGVAAFTIVDPKVPYCAPEEGCKTPWDYCCTQNDVKENIATVKIVDEAGKPVTEDARKLLGVKELSLVVVEGTAKRDDQGNLSLLANKVYLKK
ncbi:hypothetical protein [Mariniblastus fucicola]|uniref:Uncharacterized protein n=1 Tax=Mariniblastus fucicola TaxID=980251 RepID=A0A5B9PDB9_9BACT|nr:hypothetical protein [Mariniblastus fucicola]QEG23090.1 hypothetical protein MFFC18_29850 [Mariniblastus fucicola]